MKIMPEQEELLETNFKSLNSDLKSLDLQMSEIASNFKGRTLLASHPAARRQEATARQAMARRWLDAPGLMRHPSAYHVWLDLPEPWRREAFVAEARRRGVAVAPAEAFAVGRQPVPHAVRICLSAARDRTQLERGLGILAEILESGPEASPLAGPIV